MFALVVRGFLQRKLRVLLTAVAIALGVALMAGTYILTDTINNSFASIFQTANKGHDVVITPTKTLGNRAGPETSPITEQMLATVRATPGVAAASGSFFTPGAFLDTHGKRLTTGHAPAFIGAVQPKRFESFTVQHGRFPYGPDEVAIDEATAERSNLKLGEQMIVAGTAPARRYTIVGILKFAGGQSFGGASVAILTPAEAQRVTGSTGRYDQINVAAQPGVTPPELRTRIRPALPATVQVRTGSEQASKETAELEENLSFLRTFLLIFAYVAIFVGAFIIFNTFSITVAQRTREFGLLRTLGASRPQILRAVIEEGLMLGVLGAGLGLLGGIAVAPGLDNLFKAFGADIPDNGTVLATRTIVVSLAVGVVVTLLAGLVPAIRATRVPPLAAMREGVGIERRPMTARRAAIWFGAYVLLIAASSAAAGTFNPASAIGLVVIGAYLVRRVRRGGRRGKPRVVPALAHGIGALVRWRGITGQLAEENVLRQPGRTLTTASALTIGLALAALVATLASGFKATIDQAVDRSFAGNLIVENSNGTNSGEAGIPAAVGPALRGVRGVAAVTPIAFTLGRLHGSSTNETVTAIEPQSFGRFYRVEWTQGSPATLLGLDATGVIAKKSFAKSHNLSVGRAVELQTPTGRRVHLVVRGIVQDNGGLLQNLTVTLPLARGAFGLREDALVFVKYAPGFGDAEVQPAVNRLLAGRFPQARSRTAAQFKEDLSGQVNGLLTLIYVLLALSVIISLFGIVNTLVLSVYERTHELGMMRAIGTSRRQVRQMIRYESVITSLIGGVLGLVFGVVAAAILGATALSGSGYVQSFPVATLIVLLVAAALAGVLAAQLPARRAARLDMLSALASE